MNHPQDAMPQRQPRAALTTHEVTNQPRPLGDVHLVDGDPVLRDALEREGAGWAAERLRVFGALAGSDTVRRLGEQAERRPPELRAFDRWGRRIDEVEYDPAYHELMRIGMEHGYHSVAWTDGRPGSHVVHAAMVYMMTQAEPGVCCPLTMTYASVPVFRGASDLGDGWLPKILSDVYDPRAIPVAEKRSATIGMAMTEKQGGSDVRANTTRAVADGQGRHLLRGHKWFCSAPMSDGFLTLAYEQGATEDELTCFLVPRWTPEGERNRIELQRLKPKLGNRSNASSEIEYHDALAFRIGEPGRGVRTILDMVIHTRLDTAVAPAALMRAALVEALHHVRQRRAFGQLLIDQPLMRAVLADIVLEWEAATTLAFRVARAFDDAARDERAQPLSRLIVAIAKYWLNKRAPALAAEAMEVLGGSGYVEESPMPRLYREAPLNGIWEGSGNVICLDVLRTLQRRPESLSALLDELELSRGQDAAYDAALAGLRGALRNTADPVRQSRRLVEQLALLLQGNLLLRHAPLEVSSAFCASRLFGDHGYCFGTLPDLVDVDALLERAGPAA